MIVCFRAKREKKKKLSLYVRFDMNERWRDVLIDTISRDVGNGDVLFERENKIAQISIN
jgi:hypothetical protein